MRFKGRRYNPAEDNSMWKLGFFLVACFIIVFVLILFIKEEQKNLPSADIIKKDGVQLGIYCFEGRAYTVKDNNVGLTGLFCEEQK